MRFLAFLLFGLLASSGLYAQQELPAHFLSLGAGATLVKARDEALSPMLYRGVLPGGQISWLRYGYKSISRLEGAFFSGSTRRVHPPSTVIYNMAGWLDYSWQRKVYDDHNRIYLGGALQNLVVYRYHPSYSNNMIAVDALHSLSLAATVQRPFSLGKRQLQLEGSIYVPFLSEALRPSYAYFAPEAFFEVEHDEGSYVGNTLRSYRLTTLNHLQRAETKLALDYFLRNDNRLRLTYGWDYYHYSNSGLNPVRQARHTALFQVLMNL